MNFVSQEMRRNPFPVYDHIRTAAPVFHEPTSDAWMIFDYDGVKRALTDHDAFSSNMEFTGRKSPEWFIFFDPTRHTKLRGLIMRAFTPRSIASLEPFIRELSRELIDQTIERGEMDLAEDFAIPLPMIVISEMLGIPASDRARFTRWSEAILNLSHDVSGGEEAIQAAMEFTATTAEMSVYLGDLLAQRRVTPRDDLLTRLVQAEVDGEQLTDEEILGFFQLLLVAGTETTTNLLNNAILCFIEHPAELARLLARPDLLPLAIEEILRYRSPVQWMFRATRRAVALGGHEIPAGKLVLPMIGSANHDPRQFRDPGRFDITREPNQHIAFGHGIHFCLGAPLARLEARIALADVLQRVKNFELASGEPWEPRKALHVLGPAHLPIRFEPGPRAGAPA